MNCERCNSDWAQEVTLHHSVAVILCRRCRNEWHVESMQIGSAWAAFLVADTCVQQLYHAGTDPTEAVAVLLAAQRDYYEDVRRWLKTKPEEGKP